MRRILLSILLVSLASLLLFSTCKDSPSVFTFKDHKMDDSLKKMILGGTDYITWGDASPMIKAYKNHSKALKIKLPDGSIKILEGLQLDADFVRGMLTDASVRKIELFFGVNKDDLSKPAADQTFTIITAPVYFDLGKREFMVKKYRDPLGNRGEVANSELIDFCDPCPKNCPDTTQ